MKLTRRGMLTSLGLGTGAYVLANAHWSNLAQAEDTPLDELPLLVFCEFNGGWDTLMSLDPRNHSLALFNDPEGSIYTGYDLLAENDAGPGSVKEVLDSDGTGLITPVGSNISFGPAIGELASKYEQLCVVRGVDMGTLTHEVGRRYFMTGKFPEGIAATGSSMATFWVDQHSTTTPVPNLVVRSETFNAGLDPKASGLRINDYLDLSTVLRSLDASLDPNSQRTAALAALQSDPSCLERQLDVGGLPTAYRASFEKALVFSEGSLWQHFNFISGPEPSSDIYALYDAFGLDPDNPNSGGALLGPLGQAAIAAQALTHGVSQAVSIQLAGNLDHHDDAWSRDHVPALRDGFNALARLIGFLQNTEDKNGNSYWERTTLVAYSDFARTPTVNPRGGRDHHLASACIVAGQGVEGNQVIGGTTDNNYASRPIDLTTGAPDDITGTVLRPPDLQRTVLQAAGLASDHLSNEDPVVIEAMLA